LIHCIFWIISVKKYTAERKERQRPNFSRIHVGIRPIERNNASAITFLFVSKCTSDYTIV